MWSCVGDILKIKHFHGEQKGAQFCVHVETFDVSYTDWFSHEVVLLTSFG